MFKSSMSISPYSIARFLNFVLKNKKQKVLSIGICDEGDGLVAVYIATNTSKLTIEMNTCSFLSIKSASTLF